MRLGFLALAALLAPAMAHAQTKAWDSNEIRQGGKLTGCELNFLHQGTDNGSGRATPIMLKGEVDIIAPDDPRRAAWVIQLSPNDTSMVNGKIDFTQFTPIKGYFVLSDGWSSAGSEMNSQQCEMGGICVLGQSHLVELVSSLVIGTGVRMFYQRNAQTIDSEFALTLPRMGTPDHQIISKWGSCIGQLFNPGK